MHWLIFNIGIKDTRAPWHFSFKKIYSMKWFIFWSTFRHENCTLILSIYLHCAQGLIQALLFEASKSMYSANIYASTCPMPDIREAKYEELSFLEPLTALEGRRRSKRRSGSKNSSEGSKSKLHFKFNVFIVYWSGSVLWTSQVG